MWRSGLCKRWAVDRQQLIIVLVAAVMVGSFILLVLWPKQRELSALGAVLDHERGLVDQKVSASREGVYVAARIPSLRKVQTLLNRRLPTEPNVADYLRRVAECVADETDVTHEVQRGEARLSGAAPAVPIRLRLAGPFEAVYPCLAQIERMDRLTRFSRVRVSSLPEGGRVAAEAEILVYYLPEEPRTAPGGPVGHPEAEMGDAGDE